MPEGRRLKQLGIKDSPKRKLETPSTVDGLARIPKNVSIQDAEE